MITRRQTTPESSRTAPLGTNDNTARAVHAATHTTQMTTTPLHRRSIFGGATLAPWLLVLAALVACSDTPAPEGVEVDEGQDAGRDVGGDNNDPGDTGDDGPTDANNGQDADSPEDEEDSRLPLGALCTESDQCESFLCFFIAGTDQGFCSSFCIDQDNCPEEGFDCLFLQNQDEEISKVCVPLDLCIDEDGDTYGLGPACTGRDCDDGDDGRNPAASEICDGVDNDCDGIEDDSPVDANETCDTGIPGVCAEGRTRCQAGELSCDAVRFGSTEICDGRDNDCDGQTDEGDNDEPIALSCYLGPEGTEGVGACQAGARVCIDGQLGDCVGQVLPFAELCDGADNDCDGEIDEGNPQEGVSCNTDGLGLCRQGQTVCDGQGQISCVAINEPGEEVCDGQDNDCDGQIDEDEEGQTLALDCYEGDPETQDVGLCVGGVQTCVDGAFSVCQEQILPVDELCDGQDNDCDDQIDEGNPAGGRICPTGLPGVCARGETACGDEGLECVPQVEASDEICDNLDNDCDGSIDENEDGEPIDRTCYNGPEGTAGQGVCRSGTQTCQGGEFGGCVGEIRPSLERCDGVDNDCDGEVDNGNPGGGVECSTGLPGRCAVGLTACGENGEIVCVPQAEAAQEVCDGEDNDCDGLIDEGEDGEPLERSCYNGPEGTAGQGICRAGAQTCQGGSFGGCVGEIRPALERCDGVDNDCDGELDENNPGAGLDCSTGLPGLCDAGVTACNEGGSIVCVQLNEASAEVCDGEDNDCDGGVDEDGDGEPLARDCYNGPEGTAGQGICRAGAQTCQGGRFGGCVGEVRPAAEICDGIDNDCSGEADDGNPGGGVECSTGQPGRCAVGLTACGEDGEIVCVPQALPQQEVCDGFDNDCDGEIDEDENGDPIARSCFDGTPAQRGQGICQDGVEVCLAGQFGACQGQVLPTAEVCDNIDNDCSGVIDDGNPGGGIGCTTGQPGICATGQTVCQGGAVVCQADSDGEAELCDGIDNDCDGTVDNGFAGLGQTCFAGEGICRRAGVQICNPDDLGGAPICDAQEGDGNDQELCDNIDDDCDGEVDEDFRNGDGIYDAVVHCGGCGVDCNNQWPGGPQLYNVAPNCQADGNGAQCGFACVGNFVNLDGVPDNGCEFLPDPDAIYVSRPVNGGSDADPQCGTFDSPCATISNALSRALGSGAERVRVSNGLFRENVQLVAGIDLLGGHNADNWDRNPAIHVTAITGNTVNPDGPDRVAVSAIGISVPTELSGFTINAENAGAGGNSIGLYILDSDDGLTVRDCVIFAGSGGAGADGLTGQSGPGGLDGAVGPNSVIRNSQCPFNNPACFDFLGGAGGQRVCDNPGGGTTNISGGNGGGSNDPNRNDRNFNGGNGGSGIGGGGGQGGGHLLGTRTNGRRCTILSPPAEPAPGNVGQPGNDGNGGVASADTNGAFNNAQRQWRGAAGVNGQDGQHGGGGGGGGGAAGVDAFNQDGDLYYGAGGGGGGSGGCAGFAGGGGTPGGGSFAILMAFTGVGPASADQMPDLFDNRLVRGQGGNGGNGGNGGAGGDPGLGAEGGVGLDDGDFGFCLFDGAIGAEGGRGGHAGGGAGGNGGVSFDIYVQNTNNNDPGYGQLNDFELEDNVPTAGAGGAGGSSSNVNNGAGGTGRGGDSGNVLAVP